jgi:uncharacterized protein
MALSEKLTKQPPYKLLSLDGGGIRGIITVEVLGEIERLLQEKLGAGDDFTLAQYFDYIAGTSTGAVIATCLSLGMRVDEIRRFYLESAELMFEKASLLKRLHHKFEDEPLANKLRTVFAETTGEDNPTLGSGGLKTLLMMVLRNATTDSPWTLSNNPRAKYNAPLNRPGCNLSLPLWQVVRGSTAAPVYFPPEQIEVGDQKFIFVDGGVTMYNNPAFQLFLMATVEPYNVGWKTKRPEDMLLVSIGTGTSPRPNGELDPDQMNLLFNASTIPSALMFAALNEQDLLCRVFGSCLEGDPLDREIGSMIEGQATTEGFRGPVDPKLFTYVRYNAELSKQGLARLGLAEIEPEHVQKLDSVKYKAELQRVGVAVAKSTVKAQHFAGFP